MKLKCKNAFLRATSMCRSTTNPEDVPKTEQVPPKKADVREARRKYLNSKKEFYHINK